MGFLTNEEPQYQIISAVPWSPRQNGLYRSHRLVRSFI